MAEGSAWPLRVVTAGSQDFRITIFWGRQAHAERVRSRQAHAERVTQLATTPPYAPATWYEDKRGRASTAFGWNGLSCTLGGWWICDADWPFGGQQTWI